MAERAPSPAGTAPTIAIVALALAAMASGMSLRVTDALLPRLAREFAVTLGQASQVVTAFAVAYGLAQVLFGPLGDRFGKVRVVTWACAASAATSLLCALASGHGSLMAARLLAGTTAAAVIPLAMAWIGDAVPYERRQPVLARFLIGQITGFAGGVWLGGYAADHLDWRTPFFAIAAVFAAVALLLHVLRRRLPAVVTPGHALGFARMAGEFRAVLALPWARVVLLAVFFEGAALYGAFPFIVAHLHQRFALPLSEAGALVMLFAAGGLAFALGARRLVRALGEVALVRWGAALMASALATVAFALRWWWAVPACLAMGLGYYMMHNTLQTQATQMAPERRGAAVAAFASSFFLGQSAGVALCGLLLSVIGTTGVLVAGAAGVVVVAWGFNRQRRRTSPRAAPV
jgi:predicted MFS family arabinose efflux permease